MGTAVELVELSKRFGAFQAVDRVSLTVGEGEIFGFLGANGAGKSTTIRMLCGLLAPTSGRASVLGVDVARDPEGVKRRIGYMSQRFSLYDDLSVHQNIRFFGGVYGLHGAEAREREAWAIGMAGLEGKQDRLTGELPGGWKQRLALACAVLHQPKVVFLDEPTSGVDPISRRRFWHLIDEMSGNGITVFVTTHYLDEAEHCNRLAIIHRGQLVALGSSHELKQVFADRPILEVQSARPVETMAALDKLPDVEKTSIFGTAVHAVLRHGDVTTDDVLTALRAGGLDVRSATYVTPSLEDVFLDVVDRGGQAA
jgi:ABC-2 type transport system ATP-binding protein